MRRRALLALVPAVLLAAGCTSSSSTSPSSTEAMSPDEVKSKASQAFDNAGAVHIDLESSGLPKGRDGVSRATGDGVVSADRPACSGEISGVIQGSPAGVELIAIDDKTWMSFFTEDFNPIDMATLSAPNPAEFFRPGTGVGQLVSETDGLTAGAKARDGKVILQEYSGTLPATSVQRLFLLGEDADSFDVTYGIEPESGEVRRAEIVGEFYESHTMTFTVTLSDYGKSVTVDEPA